MAHDVGTILAACAGGALLLSQPERYDHFARTMGLDQTRLRLVDWISRAAAFHDNLEAGTWEASHSFWELEQPLRGLLVALVRWDGALPVPEGVIAAAQSCLPFLGIATTEPDGFPVCEAPTIPTPLQADNALDSLGLELVDVGSEVRMALHELVTRAELSAALIAYRSGEPVACLGVPTPPPPRGATHFAWDPTPVVADLLASSDLFLTLRLGVDHVALRLTGSQALLVAVAQARGAAERIREPSVGYTLSSLLESVRSRVERVSAAPVLAVEDDLTSPGTGMR